MDVLTLTKELVALQSVNPFLTFEQDGRTYGVGSEGPILAYIEDYLRKDGWNVRRQCVQAGQKLLIEGQTKLIPERYNLLAEKGDGPCSLLLFGHVDTVDVKAGWQTNPFEASEIIVNGRPRFTGLGTNDMKSGLAAILEGSRGIQPQGYKLKLAFLVDEEFWSFGAVRLLESDFLDDVALTLVPEISEDCADPESQWIGLGRLGRSEFQIDVHGHACHGADAFVHPDAVNAVHEAVALEALVIAHCRKSYREFENQGVKVGNSAYLNSHGGGRAILSVPDHASFILDRSFVPGESIEEEYARLRQLIDRAAEEDRIDHRAKVELSIRPRPTPPCKPYFFPPDHTAVQYVADAARGIGTKVAFGIGRSVADENRLAERGICTIILGPHGSGSHTSNEWVDCQSIVRLSGIYRAICGDFAKLPVLLAAIG
jgi:acetylornithine deacetylase